MTPHNFAITTLAILLPAWLVVHVYRTLKRPISQLPGPWISKWTGAVTLYYWLMGGRAQYVHNLHQKYGPIVRITPSEVSVSSIPSIKEIYSIKEVYLKAPFYSRFTPPEVSNIFNSTNPTLHRRYRRLLSSPMSESSLKTMYPIISAKVNLTITHIQQEMQSRSGAADILKWFLFMTTDIIGELTFGSSFGMLEKGVKNQYILDLERAGVVGVMRATFPSLISLSRVLPLPVFKQASAATQRMYRYAEESLARHEQLVEQQEDSTDVKKTLFSGVYKAEEDESLSPKEVRDNAMAYIVAGSDTTANTITYLIWAVCRHGTVKKRLVKELERLSKDEERGDQELKEVRYLNQVVDEALRLYAAAPSSLPRVVPSGGARVGRFWLGEGTIVGGQAYTLHRDPVVFPDPEMFEPERWESPTKEMRDAFFAFGGGSRVCLGLHLARMELRLTVARFFLAFPDAKVSTLEAMSDEDMETKIHFLISPKGKRCLIQAH